MLLKIIIANLLFTIVICEIVTTKIPKPYVFPIPFELPNRNDRSDQCWIRIEDEDLIETFTVYCYIAHAFLRNYIYEYNSRKMAEDEINVSLWSEEPRRIDDIARSKAIDAKLANQKLIRDWKTTTIMDPTVHRRLYVTKNADCRLVMYSREGMSNYNADCGKLLYFVNDYNTSSAVIPRVLNALIAVSLFLIFSRG